MQVDSSMLKISEPQCNFVLSVDMALGKKQSMNLEVHFFG